MSATVRLKCVHCGVEFDYERPECASRPGVLAELAECPNGHMAIVSEKSGADRGARAREEAEGSILMSATGRNLAGHERRADDFYATPAWCTELILPHLSRARRDMDPMVALGRQAERVRVAAHELARALADAAEGHRGWSVSSLELEEIVNSYLKYDGAPFHLRVGEPT